MYSDLFLRKTPIKTPSNKKTIHKMLKLVHQTFAKPMDGATVLDCFI